MKQVNVLFVCMGNICRSPTAEGVFRSIVKSENLLEHFNIDSAGTHSYHVGSPPDRRAMQVAKNRGVDISMLKARSVTERDFVSFDFILAMDKNNYHFLTEMCPTLYQEKLKLFLSFAAELPDEEVPDPYYGGMNGFEYVLDLTETASRSLLQAIRKQYGI